MRRSLLAAVLLALVAPALSPSSPPAGALSGWWDARWQYRFTVEVAAAGVARDDVVVEAGVDLGALMGPGATPDPATLRVVEVDGADQVLDGPLPTQFDPSSPGASAGTLLFPLTGATPAGATRRFHAYLNGVGAPPVESPPAAPLVRLADAGVVDGQPTWRIHTSAGSWHYAKEGAAFSGLFDASGKDWIGFDPTPGSTFNGEFRGIPQLPEPEGFFHPANRLSSTEVVHDGPVKVTLRSVSNDGGFAYTTELFPTFTRSTITRAASPFWFLYQGTPGGGVGPDRVVHRSTASGTVTTTAVHTSWTESPHPYGWAAFGVPGLGGPAGRSLFLAHHEAAGDMGYGLGGGAMTVFGFGRDATGSGLLTAAPQTFTYGLVDSVSAPAIAGRVAGATRPLAVTTSGVEVRPNTPLPGPAAAAGFAAVAPARLLDTRDAGVPVRAGQPAALAIAGRAGVPTTATAAVLNVTLIEPSEAAFLRLWPAGAAQPTTSSLNAGAADTVPNLVTTALGAGGAVELVLSDGAAHLAVDLVGYYAPAAPGGFHTVAPFRVHDSRSQTPLGPGGVVTLDVAAALGRPAGEVAAVALNVTAVEPSTGGYLTVYPASPEAAPLTSSLNFGPEQTVPNAVITGTHEGRIAVANAIGETDVVVDIVGWFDRDGSGARFVAVTPVRVADTRERPGRAALADGEVATVALGPGLRPTATAPAAAVAVAFNVTVTETTGVGYVAVWPAGTGEPGTSTLNTTPALTRANHALVQLGAGGGIATTTRGGEAHVIHDVVGWFVDD
jgi:hypothetical protein